MKPVETEDSVSVEAPKAIRAVGSLLIFFNVPGTDVTQGESCLDVVVFVERHHGIIIFYRSGDL